MRPSSVNTHRVVSDSGSVYSAAGEQKISINDMLGVINDMLGVCCVYGWGSMSNCDNILNGVEGPKYLLLIFIGD